jgi:hypothetical protein
MATTYEAIATVTVGSGGASSIEFTSIPATFTDLAVKVCARTDRSNTQSDLYLQFNGVTTATYSYKRILGYNGSATSDGLTNDTKGGLFGWAAGSTATASTFSNSEIYIPNYTSSNAKSFSGDGVSENNATQSPVSINAGLWSGTAAITSIKIQCYNASNFVQYSTATLYGIKNS